MGKEIKLMKPVNVIIGFLVLVAAAFFSAPVCSGADYKGKKILVVHSYHEGYKWTDDEHAGMMSVLKAGGAEIRTEYMDTKRKKSDSDKKAAASRAKKLIGEWKPDVVICSDDNTVKYLYIPHFKESSIPFVFCGINWSAEKYGLQKNAAVIIEVSPGKSLVDQLKSYAGKAGPVKIGFLAGNTVTTQKEIKGWKQALDVDLDARLVEDFANWKKEFADLQKTADVLVIYSFAGISGFDLEKAKAIVLEEGEIVTGSVKTDMSELVVLVYGKKGDEHGEWAAKTALQILGGKPASEIPKARNEKVFIGINLKIAEKLSEKGINVPPEDVDMADKIIE